jgi:hypothetical protein
MKLATLQKALRKIAYFESWADLPILIYVSDYAHFIHWTGTVASFCGDPPWQIVGFAIDSGVGYHLCDGSTVAYLNADGSTSTITLPNLTWTSAYPKFSASVSGITAAVPAAITGTATAATGASISDSTGTIDAGDGSHGSSTFVTTESSYPIPAIMTGLARSSIAWLASLRTWRSGRSSDSGSGLNLRFIRPRPPLIRLGEVFCFGLMTRHGFCGWEAAVRFLVPIQRSDGAALL